MEGRGRGARGAAREGTGARALLSNAYRSHDAVGAVDAPDAAGLVRDLAAGGDLYALPGVARAPDHDPHGGGVPSADATDDSADQYGPDGALLRSVAAVGQAIGLALRLAAPFLVAGLLFLGVGGAAVLGSIQPQPLPNQPDGSIALEDLTAAIKPDDAHFARTRLLALENTWGGQVLPQAYVEAATALARSKGLATHLDGARLFNAAVALLRCTRRSRPSDAAT